MAMKSSTAGGGEGIGQFPSRDAGHQTAVFGGSAKSLFGLQLRAEPLMDCKSRFNIRSAEGKLLASSGPTG
jgi:hypothetical protein